MLHVTRCGIRVSLLKNPGNVLCLMYASQKPLQHLNIRPHGEYDLENNLK